MDFARTGRTSARDGMNTRCHDDTFKSFRAEESARNLHRTFAIAKWRADINALKK